MKGQHPEMIAGGGRRQRAEGKATQMGKRHRWADLDGRVDVQAAGSHQGLVSNYSDSPAI